MTLYEELGISSDASTDEIRRVYRNLARLLHPDQQDDEGLRRLAEDRMKRLNLAHATLADPVRRQQYDASTALAVAPRAVTARFPAREVTWFMAGLAAATLYWRLPPAPATAPGTDREPSTQARAVPPEQARPVVSRGTARSSAGSARTQPEPQQTMRERSRPPELSLPYEPPPAPSAPALAAALAAPAIHPPVQAEPLPPALPAAPRFGGTWIYVPPRIAASDRALYPAEYVETVIQEDSGEIQGRYRARYRVPDRPISSEVAFRFAGRAEGDAAGLTWSGAGGAEGEVRLVLLSANSMRVDWMATSLGTQLGLASGTAVLTRRREP